MQQCSLWLPGGQGGYLETGTNTVCDTYVKKVPQNPSTPGGQGMGCFCWNMLIFILGMHAWANRCRHMYRDYAGMPMAKAGTLCVSALLSGRTAYSLHSASQNLSKFAACTYIVKAGAQHGTYTKNGPRTARMSCK